jgi:hypothetical protein
MGEREIKIPLEPDRIAGLPAAYLHTVVAVDGRLCCVVWIACSFLHIIEESSASESQKTDCGEHSTAG